MCDWSSVIAGIGNPELRLRVLIQLIFPILSRRHSNEVVKSRGIGDFAVVDSIKAVGGLVIVWIETAEQKRTGDAFAGKAVMIASTIDSFLVIFKTKTHVLIGLQDFLVQRI